MAQHELGLFADAREHEEWSKQLRGAGRVRSFEFHFRRKSGEIGTGLISAASMELDGQPWLISSTIDITERKAAERDRRQSERQYRSLFNSMQEGVALHKLICSGGVPDNYIVLDVNRRYEELLGMKRELVVNRLATDVYGTEAAPYLKEYASVVEGGMPFQFETYFPPLDKHFVISVTPMGEDLFATIFFDDTEQRRAQERYRLISENAADVIWMWDLEEGRCVYVSPSVEQLRGFSPEEILAQPMDRAMPDDTYRMVLGEIQRYRAAVESGDESARIRTNEIQFFCKNGTIVATETVTKLVSDARGKVRYVVGTSRDITGLKRAEAGKAKIEAQLRQAQKLESVGRLAAGVAHDFNNLLTVINGYSRLLLGGVQADDPLRGGLEEIHKAGERAAALIQQLLAFSRKQILQPRVLDLNRVVEEMRPMLARLMGEDVEVCVQLHAEPTTICADPHQLEQVLMNLAVNSRDAMPRRRQVFDRDGLCGMGREPGPIASGGARGPLRHAGGERHRRRHERRDARAHLRTVLHHQGSRKRDWTGAVDNPRHCGAERRLPRGRERAGARDDVQDLYAQGGGGAGRVRKAGSRSRDGGPGDRAGGGGPGGGPGICGCRAEGLRLPGDGSGQRRGGAAYLRAGGRAHRPDLDRRGDAGFERQGTGGPAEEHSGRESKCCSCRATPTTSWCIMGFCGRKRSSSRSRSAPTSWP